MNNQELHDLLAKAQTPAPPPELLSRFPGKIAAKLAWQKSGPSAGQIQLPSQYPYGLVIGWGLGIATVCLFFVFHFGFHQKLETTASTQQTASLQKYLREIQAVFPNQLRAIIFEKDGPRLLLSEKPDVPSSPALYIKVCNAQTCEKILTFSGQQVPINGEMCEVLQDGNGRVFVVGRQLWQDEEKASGKNRFEARELQL